MPRAVTIRSLPRAFAFVKAMPSEESVSPVNSAAADEGAGTACPIPSRWIAFSRGRAADFKPPTSDNRAEEIGLVRGALTYFASRRSAPTAKALASSNRRRRKAGSSIR